MMWCMRCNVVYLRVVCGDLCRVQACDVDACMCVAPRGARWPCMELPGRHHDRRPRHVNRQGTPVSLIDEGVMCSQCDPPRASACGPRRDPLPT